jgi:hypothetical protein
MANRQSGGGNSLLFTFHLRSEVEGKQAIKSQQLVIVHISFDSKGGKQTGNQKSST